MWKVLPARSWADALPQAISTECIRADTCIETNLNHRPTSSSTSRARGLRPLGCDALGTIHALIACVDHLRHLPLTDQLQSRAALRIGLLSRRVTSWFRYL